ncbi:uncharacterized protein [Populus alba]
MATQVDESTVKLNPGVVGIAFAEQYYNTLSKSPELLHNFYNDSSLIGRPGLDGSVSSASTLELSNQPHSAADAISRAAIQESLEELFLLGALTDDCKLSDPVGHQMARLPLDPVYSKALILAS